MFGGKKLEPTKLSFYEFEKERLDSKLTKILGSKYMNETQKEKLRLQYQKKIAEYDHKILMEKMKKP